MKHKVLLVDDDTDFREHFRVLSQKLFRLATAANYEEGLRAVHGERWDAVLLDVDLQCEPNGLDLLAEIRRVAPDLPVIMISGDDQVETVVHAMRNGARDYVPKHPELELLRSKVALAVEESAWRQQARDATTGVGPLLGASPAMARLRDEITRVAPTSYRVLVRGESGSGKELVARAIHELSPRQAGRMVRLNSAAGSDELFDDALFGHEKGAFTDARLQRKGALELADGGTLFLDEVGKMNLGRQAKLLRVLEDDEFTRIGAESPVPCDVRWITASNEELEAAVESGDFAGDFFHRIREFEIRVPALRERLEDLPELAVHLLERTCAAEPIGPRRLSADALACLHDYDWPGNVRELDVVLKNAALFSGEIVDETAVRAALSRARLDSRNPRGPRLLSEARDEWERGFLLASLLRNGDDKNAVALEIGKSRSWVYERLKQLGIGDRGDGAGALEA